jgi:guanylate kinase
VKKSDLNAKFVFVKPPSVEELEKRLRGRGTETEEAVQKRLDQALKELEFAQTPGIHDKIIVNDDLDRAYKELDEYIMAQLE